MGLQKKHTDFIKHVNGCQLGGSLVHDILHGKTILAEKLKLSGLPCAYVAILDGNISLSVCRF